MGIAQIPGRVIFGLIGRRLTGQSAAVGAFGVAALAFLLLAASHRRWSTLIFVVAS